MPDYENSKIYKIYDNTNGNIYIGSTTEKYLSKRLQHHLSKYNYWIKNDRDKKLFMSSYEIFNNNNYHIELIENINCKDIYELKNRERYYIENCECINRYIPNRNMKEYREDNKSEILEKKKIYRENNKSKIKVYNTTKIKCECGCEITRNGISKHKKTKKHLDLMNKIEINLANII